ncbi:hypothetical protein BHM03_00037453, partial [Ensete ventricosum]
NITILWKRLEWKIMERVFSVEEIPDPFWPGTDPPAENGGGGMNRSASEWYFEKFLEVAEEKVAAAASGLPIPNADSGGGVREDGGRAGARETTSAKVEGNPAATVRPSDPPPAGVDPVAYAAMLKQRLDMYCAAVAMSRVRNLVSYQRIDLLSIRYVSSCTEHTDTWCTKVPSVALLYRTGVQGRPATSGSSREYSDEDEADGEAETRENMDPADEKRLRRMVQVKMAEDSVKRLTGISPLNPTISDMSAHSIPFSGSPSDVSVPIRDDKEHFFQAQTHDRRMKPCLSEIASVTPADVVHGAVGGGKIGRTASMQRVASLEHLQKKICGGGQNSCMSAQWDSTWDPESSVNNEQNQA